MSALRTMLCGVAWGVGEFIYLVAMVLSGVYDGCGSLIFQPICGGIVSGMFVAIALLLGMLGRLTLLGRWWDSFALIGPAITFLAGIGLLCGSSSLGWTTDFTDPETGQTFEGIHPAAAIAGYFAILFAIVNVPLNSSFLNSFHSVPANSVDPMRSSECGIETTESL